MPFLLILFVFNGEFNGADTVLRNAHLLMTSSAGHERAAADHRSSFVSFFFERPLPSLFFFFAELRHAPTIHQTSTVAFGSFFKIFLAI